MTDEEWSKLRPGNRLKETFSYGRSRLWRVMEVDFSGVQLWDSSTNERQYLRRDQLEDMVVVWDGESQLGPVRKSIWERLSEED